MMFKGKLGVFGPVGSAAGKAWGATKYVGKGAVAGAGLMGGLAVGSTKKGWSEFSKKSPSILILPLLLVFVDLLLKQNGIALDFLFNNPTILTDAIFRIVIEGPYWIFLALYLIFRKPKTKEEWLYPAVLLLIGLLTFAFGGYNNWILFHFVFAGITFIALIKGLDSSVRISQVHWVFLLVYVIDIFGLASLKVLNNTFLGAVIPDVLINRLIFPIWFFFYLALVKSGPVKDWLMVIVVIAYGGYFGFNYFGIGLTEVQSLDEELTEAGEAPKRFYDNWLKAIREYGKAQIDYAITGKVEENQVEPLGVYLENVKSAEPRYYEDEDVIIWGSIKARTLDDPINIKVGCYTKEDKKKKQSDVDPDKKFSVSTLEEQDFVCTFKKWELDRGSKVITTFADFNFETLAQLKVYFIDNDRKRAMRRENVDIFKKNGITDTEPVAIFTNGPAAINIETTEPLVGVSESLSINPSLSISLINREGWQGKIRQLNELVILLPENVILGTKELKPEEACGAKIFNEYGLNQCKEESCREWVYDECADVCDKTLDGSETIYDKETNTYKPVSGNRNSINPCVKECVLNANTCVDACDSLFEEGHNGYRLNLDKLEVRDEFKDFDRFKTFRCRINPDPQVLDSTEITTKFIRVRARYNYTVEEKVTVKIDEIPKEIREKIVAPPSNLRVSKLAGEDKLYLQWDLSKDDGEREDDVTSYIISRREESAGGFDTFFTKPKGTESFVDNPEGSPPLTTLKYCYPSPKSKQIVSHIPGKLSGTGTTLIS